MDTQTRHALKGDKFAQATASSVNWLSGHRSGVVRWVVLAIVAAALLVGGTVFWNMRSAAASAALGKAMDIYSAPLAMPGAPPEEGVYPTAAERSKAANQQFLAVARDYGWIPEGSKAHYFAGVTYQEMGQTTSAESELKSAVESWNRNTANLARLALANLYHQTNRNPQAIEIYNKLAEKPSETVGAAVAQLYLADLYGSEGKTDQARALWAKVKDADKDGAAGSIATQRLAAR